MDRIKESFDSLPIAACFFDKNGVVRLINRRMLAIANCLRKGGIQSLAEMHSVLQAPPANVGLARSKRFPSITLTGAGGIVSSSIEGISDGHSWAWSAVGSLVQPIFNFGKLKRQEQVARERYYQSVFAYEETVLEALGDVEKSLLDIATYRSQAENYARLLRANIEIATMTNSLYRNGMSAYLDVIDAERNMYQSQMEYVNLVAQQYINYVNLFKALGGGW